MFALAVDGVWLSANLISITFSCTTMCPTQATSGGVERNTGIHSQRQIETELIMTSFGQRDSRRSSLQPAAVSQVNLPTK
ncbi:unnamed protein product [Acanthoscelides obtectus]|uniref:Secreted protein n=1 Tax=Acanthoscelides obtectus TaxID=200917 RepID=A0A9P0K2U3_ACAOB|nr:unnamed protein product [Acanthoscelides obtectus]CAK1631623.1 hypothetical protein AOBTE_LOCUS7056 [Acanthoscelides obtectus]